jgi:hypothetical protein
MYQGNVGIEAPSKSTIAKALVVAIVVAAIVLVTAVLPAEYGIDPLGVGAALGLTNLSTAEVGGATPEGAVPAPVQTGVNVPQPNVYKVDAEDFGLFPGDGFEFKYKMEKGAVMVYSWKASDVLEFEFHGEPDEKPNPEYYESYELDKEGKTSAFGSFTAPSTGVHGWYWKNNGDEPVSLRLTTAGFYSAGKMYSAAGIEDMPLQDVE